MEAPMTSPFWIGTSWKMNKTLRQARDYAQQLLPAAEWRDPRLQAFIIPPFTALATVCEALKETPLLVGAQNMHWADHGAYTGEISPPMIKDCGAALVELGHSERRSLFNETDKTINCKVQAALAHGLRPLICVGESERDKRYGLAAEVVAMQVKIALHGLMPAALRQVLIAYEPVWAIGESGIPATPDYANEMHGRIRLVLAALTAEAAQVPILYGGSVNLQNCRDLAAQPQIDGLFIGRAAWEAAGFLEIVRAVLPVVPNRENLLTE